MHPAAHFLCDSWASCLISMSCVISWLLSASERPSHRFVSHHKAIWISYDSRRASVRQLLPVASCYGNSGCSFYCKQTVATPCCQRRTVWLVWAMNYLAELVLSITTTILLLLLLLLFNAQGTSFPRDLEISKV